MDKGLASGEIVQFVIFFFLIEPLVFWLVGALALNWLAGLAAAVLLFDIVYLGKWMGGGVQFIVGAVCIFVLVGVTIWPLLYGFLEAGLPSLMYGLESLVAPAREFQSYFTVEYWTFIGSQPTVYEQTTDNPGVPPNIAFQISRFEIKPSSSVMFDQSMVLWITVENEGDDDLGLQTGFRVPIIGGYPNSAYPCPCEIFNSEESWSAAEDPYFDEDCTVVYESTLEIAQIPEEYHKDWSDTIAQYSPLAFSSCGVIGGETCTALTSSPYYDDCSMACRDYEPEDRIECRNECLIETGCDANAVEAGYCTCEEEITVRAGLPHNEYCTGVVFYPRHNNLTAETCQIEAYAQADLHSRSILPVQVVNTSYYFQRGLTPETVPSVASTGSGVTSIAVGEQPLLDIEPNMIVSVGFRNEAQGDIKRVYQIYLFIDPGITNQAGNKLWCEEGDLESFECNVPCPSAYGDEFLGECTDLVGQGYTLCRLKESGDPSRRDIIENFIVANNFAGISCTIKDVDLRLSDYYRRSYLLRADTFYRYEMETVTNVNGIKVGT